MGSVQPQILSGAVWSSHVGVLNPTIETIKNGAGLNSTKGRQSLTISFLWLQKRDVAFDHGTVEMISQPMSTPKDLEIDGSDNRFFHIELCN